MDLPHVLKLGKGPEQGHVNCSLFIPKNFRHVNPDLVKFKKMSVLSHVYVDELTLTVAGCIVILSTTEKEITHGT
jgi:hypothetical protein